METSNTIGRSALILGISVGFGVLFNYFFFEKLPPGIGFTIYIALIIAAFFGLSRYSGRAVRGDLLWLFPLLVFFAAMVAVRSNELLTLLNVFACLGLLILIMEVSVRGSMRKFIPTDYLKLLIPFRVIDPFIAACADALAMRRSVAEQKKTTQILRGVIITIPIVVIFGILLSHADPIFGKYTSLFTTWNFTEEDIGRLIFTVVVACLSTAFFSYTFTAKAAAQSAASDEERPFGHIETSILLGSVNILFLAFIVIQLAYLFGGESNIIAQGLTYAEYARRGFFELVAVAALSYLILVVTERLIEKGAEQHSPTFKILSSAVILQVGVIMISAFYRMWLYEEAFGFTTMRLYVHAFIVLLGFVLACLLYKIVVEHRDNTFAFRTFLAIVIFVAGMNIFNPDAFIAQKNLQRFAATGKLDTVYLTRLSSDATPVLIEGMRMTSGDARRDIGHIFYTRAHDTKKASQWMEWNRSRANENILLTRAANELDAYAATSTQSL